MHNITLISTVHDEIGKCNADELYFILEKIRPEVLFLEAIESTYTKYQKHTFLEFGIYHQKLEIKAIQKYSLYHPFKYVPVLESGLPESIDKKYNQLSSNAQLEKMLNDYNSLASERGFEFINSSESVELQEEMRIFEKHILNDNELDKAVNDSINTYEDSMMQNIYSFSKSNRFDKGIFMCGVAHRASIIKKIEIYSSKEKVNINWDIYGK